MELLKICTDLVTIFCVAFVARGHFRCRLGARGFFPLMQFSMLPDVFESILSLYL